MLDLSYTQNKLTLKDGNFNGKTVLVRVDFNVPVQNGKVLDSSRIIESLPTIQYLISQNARVILISHFGRPKEWDPGKSLEPAAKELKKLLETPVYFYDEPIGSEALDEKIKQLPLKSVALLENIRFYEGETKNSSEFSKILAFLADFYVNDAFGSMHRAHASTEGVTHFLPSYMGLLPEKEISYVYSFLNQAKRPITVILGGGKTSTKITLLKGLMQFADHILIGGGMVFTFLKARGFNIGKSLFEEETLPIAKEILEESKTSHAKLYFPLDIVCSKEFKENATATTIDIDQGIKEDEMGLDIGPKTRELYNQILKNSKTIFWNGPLGVFELKPFDEGTKSIAHQIGAMAEDKEVMILVGGGESSLAAKLYGIEKKVTHISTGGGALLELLEGVKLPGLMAIHCKK